jgi:putative oxidoreductase
MKQKYILEGISYAFVFLFVYAALNKLLVLNKFQVELSKTMLTKNFSLLLSVLVPLSEIIAASLLLFKKTRKWGLYCSLFLMSAFTIYIIFLFAFEPSLPCHCGGIIDMLNWKGHLIFNTLFTLLAAYGIWLEKRARSIRNNPTFSYA